MVTNTNFLGVTEKQWLKKILKSDLAVLLDLIYSYDR